MQTGFLFLVIFATALVSLLILTRVAKIYNWLDSPSQRKVHQGDVPLVGGLSILFGVIALVLTQPEVLDKQYQFICLAVGFLAIGFFDDKYSLSVKLRLILLLVLSVWVGGVEEVALFYLGNLFGNGDIFLSQIFILLFTVAAIIGCVTAFNMIDGLDGLLGVLSSVTFLSLFIVFHLAELEKYALFCAGFIIAMLPYIAFNVFSKARHRVFMGDAGSAFVGFIIIWLLLFLTQPKSMTDYPFGVIKPIYVLWFIAIPFMDMMLVIIKRGMRRQSLTSADRTHIHHLLLECGLSANKILLLLSGTALCLASVGLWCHFYAINQFACLVVFSLTFLCYAIANLSLEKQISQGKIEMGIC
ncbi:hypothetical protein BIY20_20675 [Vibrio panuliri]|uniref:Undecaprenyl-phosphate alpha-N-acetylglucosaminyl 1-phosphate transferase n=2 Tax=Vibrio panuliri TaxID=1381081 RepID=A0ABX3FPG4_9VIBR|nr:hypothetical protein BIY20_20675 [Vibrio panuliri]